MKTKKIRSVKRASFSGILKGSLVFVLLNCIIVGFFVITVAYLLVSNNEDNLVKLLVSNLTEKMDSIKVKSDELVQALPKLKNDQERNIYIEQMTKGEKAVMGFLIMDKDGIIVNTTKNYKNFIGFDFSGKEYYSKVIESKKPMMTRSYVSYVTRNTTINYITPLIKDDKIDGMVVTLINPLIIESKELKGLEYYLADYNGDILFKSTGDNVVKYEDNISGSILIENAEKGNNRTLFYKDRIQDKYMFGTIRNDANSSMYIVVQYDVFGDKVVFRGLIFLFALSVLFVLIFIFLFSAEITSISMKYIDVFRSEVRKIYSGNYDISLSKKYPHEEINEIIDSFVNMAHKIRDREEELQSYNEELIAANDEIKKMISTIGENEKEKKEQYIQIIWTLLNLLEIKDEYTAGHSRAVTIYAEKIADILNSDYGMNVDIEKIRVAASLHDIGKIGIEKEILNKPSKLTNEEYEIIKTHPSKGYYALKDIDNLKEERRMIKYHHERFDGRGYPEGIRGDAIPLSARIICVADAFDAMVSDRPYRKGMTTDAAIAELIKNRGKQFDPLVVDVFVDMFRGESFNLVDGMEKHV